MIPAEMIGGRFVLASSLTLLLGPCDKLASDDPAPPSSVTVAARPVEELVLEEARQSCISGNCASGYARANATIPKGSEFRKGAPFRELEALWAKEIIEGAHSDPDARSRVEMLREVAETETLDPKTRDLARAAVQGLEKRAAPRVESPFDKEWRLSGYEASKISRLLEARLLGGRNPKAMRSLLLPRVAAGMAYREEAELLLQACQRMKDAECTARVSADLDTFPVELDELRRQAASDPESVRATILRRIKENVSSVAENKLLAELCAQMKDETCLRRKR